jgi:hypothetical protein
MCRLDPDQRWGIARQEFVLDELDDHVGPEELHGLAVAVLVAATSTLCPGGPDSLELDAVIETRTTWSARCWTTSTTRCAAEPTPRPRSR